LRLSFPTNFVKRRASRSSHRSSFGGFRRRRRRIEEEKEEEFPRKGTEVVAKKVRLSRRKQLQQHPKPIR